MSYRLIDSNAIAIKYPEVNEMPCVFANLPDGMNGQFIDVQPEVLACGNGELVVKPEPHEGHWIPHESPDDGEQYECSECGVLWEFNDGSPEDNEAYYCPKCGAKMKGDSNDR